MLCSYLLSGLIDFDFQRWRCIRNEIIIYTILKCNISYFKYTKLDKYVMIMTQEETKKVAEIRLNGMMQAVKTQWHPAFCAAIELELAADKGNLEYTNEYNLTSKPLQIRKVLRSGGR